MRNLTEDEFTPWGSALQILLGPAYVVSQFHPDCDERELGWCLGLLVEHDGIKKTVVTLLGLPSMPRPDISVWAHEAAPAIKASFGITPKWRN